MTDTVLINEVGLRDGLQGIKTPVSLEGKLRLAQALMDAGLQALEVTSFVSPKAVPQMADASDLFAALPRQAGVRYSALVPNLRGLERAVAASVGEVALVLSATETMNQRNINMGLAETRASCVETIQTATRQGLTAKAYVAVAFECPFEGAVAPETVLSLAGEMLAAGASEVVIADTIGAANPAQVRHLMTEAAQEFGASRLAAHFHDTRGFALANIWAALEAGLRKFDSSLGGLGGCPFAPGAAGNVATEDVMLMAEQCGYRTGIDLEKLLLAIGIAEELVGQKLGGRTSKWIQSRRDKKAG